MAERTILFDVKLDTKDLESNAKEAVKKLEVLKEKQKQLKESSGTNTVEYAKLSNEIRATNKQLKDNASALEINERLGKRQSLSLNEQSQLLIAGKNAYRNLSEEQRKSPVGKQLLTDVKNLNEELKKSEKAYGDNQREVGNYANATKKLTSTLGALGLAFGGIAIARNVMGTIIDFDQALADLTAISGKSAEELKPLNEQAKQLGATTAFSATQVTELQIELAKLGFTTQQISESSESILSFASATGADLASAAALGGSALRAFGLEATEMDRVVSVLGVATTKTALDFAKLETGLSTVAPVAKAFGFSIEDTTALLGQLANAGFDASSSATATRNILLKLADANGDLAKELGRPIKSADDLAGALKELSDKGIDLGKSLELTDARSVAAFNTFINGSDTLVELRDSITDVSAELKEMADKRLDSVTGATTIFKSAWEGLTLSLNEGTGVSKVLQRVIEFLANNLITIAKVVGTLLATFTAWKVTTIATRVATTAYTTALSAMGGQLSIANVRTLIADKSMKMFNATTKANPLGLLISLLVLAGTAFLSFSDATTEAEKSQKRLNDAVADGQKIGQQTVKNQNKITNEFLQGLKDKETALKIAGKTEQEINEEINADKKKHFAEQSFLTEKEIKGLDLKLQNTLTLKDAELEGFKELTESSRNKLKDAKAIDRTLFELAVKNNLQQEKLIKESIENEKRKTQASKDELTNRLIELKRSFNETELATVEHQAELTDKEKAELLKRQADLQKLRERAEDLEDARISNEFERKEQQLKRSFDREMQLLVGNEIEKENLRKELQLKLDLDIAENQSKRDAKSLELAKKAIEDIDKLQSDAKNKEIQEDAEMLVQELKLLEKHHKEKELLALKNVDSTQAEEKARMIEFFKEKIELQKAYGKDVLDLEIELQKLINSKTTEEVNEKLQQQTTLALTNANQLSASMFQVVQNRLTKELNAVTDRYDEEAVNLQSQLDEGLISETEYLAKKNNIDDKFRKDSAKIKEEQFKRQRQADLIQASVNQALAVTSILAQYPKFDGGIAMAIALATTGILGATQIGLIASQPIPKFAKGGVFGGNSHSNGGTKGTFSDGTQIEVEKDEAFFVLNKRATQKIGMLSSINQSTGGVPLMAGGGRVQFESGMSAVNVASQVDARNSSNNDMMNAIRMMPNPVVAVQDINEVQGNLTNVVNFASF